MEHVFDALVVEPELNSRALLKQCIYSLGRFRRIIPARDIAEAQSAFVAGEMRPAVVYVSTKLGSERVMQFIGEAKQSELGKQSRYIVVLKKDDQTQASVAKNLLSGADGFLCEPFSIESVRTTSSFALQLKADRKQEIMKSAFQLLIDEMIADISRLVALKSSGKNADHIRTRLSSLQGALTVLDPQWLEMYRDMAIEAFIRRPPPVPVEALG